MSIKIKIDNSGILDNALTDLKQAFQKICEKYNLTYYEAFGIVKALDVELTDSSKDVTM